MNDDEHKRHGGDPERLRDEARFLEDEARRLEDEERRIDEEKRRLQDRAHQDEDEAERIERDRREHAKIRLTVVVNGTPVEVLAHAEELLGAVRDKALHESRNVGRPAEDWELKDEAGNVLPLDRPVREFRHADATILFLSLRAGVAGAR